MHGHAIAVNFDLQGLEGSASETIGMSPSYTDRRMFFEFIFVFGIDLPRQLQTLLPIVIKHLALRVPSNLTIAIGMKEVQRRWVATIEQLIAIGKVVIVCVAIFKVME